MHEKEQWVNAIRDNSSETIASIILADIERIEKQQQEIERLNDIINELEDRLEKQRNNECEKLAMKCARLGIPSSHLLDKSQELKGEDKK